MLDFLTTNLNLIYLIYSIFMIILSGLLTILTMRGSKKAKTLKNTLQLTSNLKGLTDFIMQQMSLVENTKFDSSSKLEYVLTKAHQFCIDNSLNYDESSVKSAIERLINFSKCVNSKGETT